MPGISPTVRLLLLTVLPLQALQAQQSKQHFFPGVSAVPATVPYAGVAAAPAGASFPGVTPYPLAGRPLNGAPSVVGLEHLDAAQMNAADTGLVSDLHSDLLQQAALASFDISQPAWHYQQVVSPVFPDYVLLAFTHGPDQEGSSRFLAVLARDRSRVRIVSTYGHGLLPFEAAWSRPGNMVVFNEMLQRERGRTSLAQAPDWLLIGVTYAEFAGYPAQVLSTLPLPDPTLDLLRLQANQPQMLLFADQAADITFSDVSQAASTANWTLHFSRQGELLAGGRTLVRQPATIALKP